MRSPPERIKQSDVHEDAVRAIKFVAIKAAIFILVPMICALVAIWWRFG